MPTRAIAGDPRFAVTGNGGGLPRNCEEPRPPLFVLPGGRLASEITIRLSNGVEFGVSARFAAGAVGDLLKSEAAAGCLKSRREATFRKIRKAARGAKKTYAERAIRAEAKEL